MLLPIASRFFAAMFRPDSPCWKLICGSWGKPLVDRLWRSSKNLFDIGVGDRAASGKNKLHCAVDRAHAVDAARCEGCSTHRSRAGLCSDAERIAARGRCIARRGPAVPFETRDTSVLLAELQLAYDLTRGVLDL